MSTFIAWYRLPEINMMCVYICWYLFFYLDIDMHCMHCFLNSRCRTITCQSMPSPRIAFRRNPTLQNSPLDFASLLFAECLMPFLNGLFYYVIHILCAFPLIGSWEWYIFRKGVKFGKDLVGSVLNSYTLWALDNV